MLLLLYFVAYLDRVNLGFAANAMQRDLGFSNALYGTGAGLFFLGALIAQVPSNLLLARLGARRTIAALMVMWSLVSGATAFVHTPHAFLLLRLLLGMAEAGFYPGVIYYLTLWLPRNRRASFTATFLFAIPMASILGGPVSTWILEHGRQGRFADWQVLLLMEAAPALLLGLIVPFVLADSPQQARWLTAQDRTTLENAMCETESTAVAQQQRSAASFVTTILLFSAIYFTMQFALYTQSFWLPKILASVGEAQKIIGWQVAAVSLIAAIGMLLWGRVADRAPSAHWTLWAPLIVSSLGYLAVALCLNSSAIATLLLLSFGLGAAGSLAATPPFWTQLSLRQSASALAISIAVVNALGNLGGFAGPAVLGHLQQHFGTYTTGLMLAAAGLLLSAGLTAVSSKQ